jgi:hypothetical protein
MNRYYLTAVSWCEQGLAIPAYFRLDQHYYQYGARNDNRSEPVQRWNNGGNGYYVRNYRERNDIIHFYETNRDRY